MPRIQNTKVAVVLTKTIYLSKGALQRNNIARDAVHLAQKDFIDEVNEKSATQNELAQKGHSLLTSLFDIKVIDSPKYSIPNNKEKKHSYSSYVDWNDRKISLADAVRLIVNYNLEKKYGVLDYEKNPDIFNVIPPIKNGDQILVPERHALIEKIEEEFYNLRDLYSQILMKPESNMPNVELVIPSLGEYNDDEHEYDEDEDYNDEEGGDLDF